MDHTLAMIIHPMLVQLKATQHGHPASLTIEKWDEILDEMIYITSKVFIFSIVYFYEFCSFKLHNSSMGCVAKGLLKFLEMVF